MLKNNNRLMITIKRLEDSEKSKWDDYVKSSQQGTFYHLSEWKDVIEETYKLKSHYLMAMDQSNDIKGILPLFLMKNPLFKKFLISNPYSNYCGICSDSKEIEVELLNRAKSINVENKAQYLEIRCLGKGSENPDQVRDAFVNMMLDLSPGEEKIWSKIINSKVRNSVRKGIKSELEFDSGKHYFDSFYEVFSTNMRDLGTPPHSRRFFQNILLKFDKQTEIFVVKHHGKVVGTMFGFFTSTVFSEPWASTLREYNRYCPADFLYWEAIKYACAKGFQQFDFGRSTVDTGTYKFKKKWGAKPVTMSYQYYLNLAKQAPIVNAVDNKYEMAVNIWQKLPLICANVFGPKLIRYLPEL